MPLQTIAAFLDHGAVARTIEAGLDAAQADLRRIEELGISLSDVTDELINEGVATFDESFDELLTTIRGASTAGAHA